ncbi:MAG: tetratricopeptide repeat protein [Lachnospiraceae bacterium]|nr:tetratricopeptide repeat protein [Lachnospiraceae bacterium]
MKKIQSAFIVLIVMFILAACSGKETAAWQEQYDLGMQYLTEGDYEAAIVAFTAAIEIDSKDIQAYTGLAQAYIGMNDYESAAVTAGQGAEAIKDAVQVQVDGAVDEFTATLLTLAELCLDEGNYESAETIYSLIIGINENCVDGYVARAEIYIILGEREKALEDYRKVLELLQQGEIGKISEDEIERLINELDSTDEASASDGEDGRAELLLEEMYMVMDGVSTLLQRYTYNEDGSVSTYYECDSDSTYSMYEV